MKETIISTYLSSHYTFKLYDIPQDYIRRFIKKSDQSVGDLDLFDDLVALVIEGYFLYGIFDNWEGEFDRSLSKKSSLANIFKSKVKHTI